MSQPSSGPARRMHQPYAGVGTPPQPSSLGTPSMYPSGGFGGQMGNTYQQGPPPQRPPHYYQNHNNLPQSPHYQGPPSHGGRGGYNRGPNPGSYGRRQAAPAAGSPSGQDPILVPTRPLLKALAHECKPFPPWSVGGPTPAALNDELIQFSQFLAGTPEEKGKVDALIATALDALRQVWPQCELRPMGLTAANVHSYKDTVVHLYAAGTSIVPEGCEVALRAAVNGAGFQADFFTDCRNCSCVLLTEARTGDRCSIRFGPSAEKAKPCADLIATVIASKEQYRIALVALEALLRQNKMLDDGGVNLSQLSGEALAVMVIAIVTSYSNDTPDAGRLLIDFFLTYGFQAHFDVASQSICPKVGMAQPAKKRHPEAHLSVVDPGDDTVNLSLKTDKVPLLLAVFNYCYTAMSQFEQVDQGHRRAQSPLSTIIGGEAYWSRVLQLYHQKVSPFYDVVRAKSHALAHHR